MKTRKELIQQCTYPFLPSQSFSVQKWKHQKNLPRSSFWLGGRLVSISKTGFLLQSGSTCINCQLAPNSLFFLDFQVRKGQLWEEIHSLLKQGDSISIYIHSVKKQIVFSTARLLTISSIKKIVLTATCHTSSTVDVNSKKYKKWLQFIDRIRHILAKMGLDPVETPSLVHCPGTEVNLEVFQTKQLIGNKFTRIFLPTSPEMNLKKLLCQGWTDFYEIKKCFRNKESGPFNSCEFYLLEWYRAYSDWHSVMDEVYYLIKTLSDKWNNFSCPSLQKITMQKLFKKYLNMYLDSNSSRIDFIYQLKKMAIPFRSNESKENLFHLLFLNGIEPALDKNIPIIIYNYPPFEKAYARINQDGWARRFELFWKGLELANGFDEVHTITEQKKRFQTDLHARKKKNKIPVPMDTELLQEMKKGMPPTAGVALGLDRLFLILNQLNCIGEIKDT